MRCTKVQCFLLLVLSLAVPLTIAAQQTDETAKVKRQLYDAFNAGDAQTFASLVDGIGQKDRDDFLLYMISQSNQQPLEIVRVLIDKGADINQPTRSATALMRAAEKGYTDIVRLLLAKGVQVNVNLAYESENAEMATLLPAPRSLKRQPPNVLNAFLRAAVGKQDEARVKELLTAGADPNHEYAIDYDHKSIKSTVLILAASMGHPGIVQLLLDKGANVNAKGLIAGSEHGLEEGTALEAAEASKHAEVAALLRKVRQD